MTRLRHQERFAKRPVLTLLKTLYDDELGSTDDDYDFYIEEPNGRAVHGICCGLWPSAGLCHPARPTRAAG
jgi:hypothetical protein